MPERDRSSPSVLHARRWRALAVIGLARFMVILDVTVVNVASPSIESDLGLGRLLSAFFSMVPAFATMTARRSAALEIRLAGGYENGR